MLKNLVWGLVAFAMLVGAALAAGGSDGGMLISTLSNNITTALSTIGTNIVSAITGTAVQTCAPGVTSCTQALLIQGAVGATPVNTAPQSNVPAASVTGTLANAGDAVTITGVDGYGTLSVEATGPATWTGTTIVEMQPKGSSQWYTTKIGDFEGNAPGVSALPTAVAAQLFFKTGGVAALRIRAVTAITNGPLTINLAGMASLKDLRASAPVGNPLNTTLVFNGAVASLASAFPFQLSVGGAALSAANPVPSADIVAGAPVSSSNPEPTTGTGSKAAPAAGALSVVQIGLPWQTSTAIEACHVFKTGAGIVYRIKVTIGATSGYLKLYDAASAPADGTDTPKVIDPVGSNGTWGWYDDDFGGTPMTVTNGLVACFSTTGGLTKTGSATAFFAAQMP